MSTFAGDLEVSSKYTIGMYPDGEANARPDPVVAEYGEAQTPVCASHRALRESVDFRDPTR